MTDAEEPEPTYHHYGWATETVASDGNRRRRAHGGDLTAALTVVQNALRTPWRGPATLTASDPATGAEERAVCQPLGDWPGCFNLPVQTRTGTPGASWRTTYDASRDSRIVLPGDDYAGLCGIITSRMSNADGYRLPIPSGLVLARVAAQPGHGASR